MGDASFAHDHTVRITDPSGDVAEVAVSAENIVIAVGTRPARPAGVDFDEHRVIDSDGVLSLAHPFPRTMAIVGAG